MKPGDTAHFDTERYTRTRDAMAARSEEVHAKGREIYRKTGHMDPLVDVKGKLRLSHNSFKKDGDKAILVNGIALPVWSGFDGTGSMGEMAGIAHAAMGEIMAMLNGVRHRYNPQLSTSVVQDVCDPHPVFQMSQFETDERVAEQIRLLIPDGGGGDSTEDYQLALAYLMLAVDADINNFYGLKGYGFIVGDEIGRERVEAELVLERLGHKLQKSMTTKAVAKEVLKKWHLFYIVVGNDHGTSDWWLDKLGAGRVVMCPEPHLLAEVQAALVYATETDQPTKEGLFEFLSAGGSNKKVTKKVANEVWSWIEEAKVPFGAQTKLSGYADIPMPGAVFEHYRHQWPVGHPKFVENVIPVEPAVSDPSASGAKREKPDWNLF